MLELSNINVSFKSEYQSSLFSVSRQQVLHDVSFKVKEGSCLGILGESGSGKSTIGRVLSGLLKPDNGQVTIDGLDVYKTREGRNTLKRSISIVFQDYTTSVNPRFTVEKCIKEGLKLYKKRGGSFDFKEETVKLLKQVGLDETYMHRYPHELSGGQLQRVCIARAIACHPRIILFDEAISSLDAHTQVQLMDLLKDLQDKYNLTYVFVTHDLTAITYICDEVLFLKNGTVTEFCDVSNLANIKDEYALNLLNSIIDFEVGEKIS